MRITPNANKEYDQLLTYLKGQEEHRKLMDTALEEREATLKKYSKEDWVTTGIDVPSLMTLIKPQPQDLDGFSIGAGFGSSYIHYYMDSSICLTAKQDIILRMIANSADTIKDKVLEDLIKVNPLLVKYIPKEWLTDEMKMAACLIQPHVAVYIEEQNKELQEFLLRSFTDIEALFYIKHPLPHIWDAIAASIIRAQSKYVFVNAKRIEFKRIKWGRNKDLSMPGASNIKFDLPAYIKDTVIPLGQGGNPAYKDILLEIADAIEGERAAEAILKEVK